VIVCHCKSVTERAIRKAVRNGARTRSDVVDVCSASLGCGGCAPAIDEIIASECERECGLSFTALTELATVS